MKLKKTVALIIAAALMLMAASTAFALDADNIEPWERSAETHRENLGNTMDGHSSMIPSERAWQPRAMTKEQITSMHDGGYNTIRIPVTWGLKITRDKETGEYIINENWLNRVNEVVYYAIDNGMYVIINIHHDGVNWSKDWLNIGNNDIDSVMEKYAAVWRIIAERFKDYDEHLIFESMNEITSAQAAGNMWNGGSFEYDVDIIRNFNQLFVNTVRSTGSNNTKRWLASKGHFAYTGRITMPIDPLNEGVSHQMYSAHIYNSVENRYKGIKELADNYKDLGCPLILGEWTTYTGDNGSAATGYNDVEKAFQSELVYKYAKVNNICAIAWDIGVFEKNGRITAKRAGTTTITAYALNTVEYGYYGHYNADPYANAVKKEITVTVRNTDGTVEISGSDSLGLVADSSALLDVRCDGEVLTYTSDNEAAATVNSVGRVFAQGEGTACITAVSASGASKTINITVSEKKEDGPGYINVGIFVLYNDAVHNYWDNEIGETVQITKNGTYTLTYDIAQHQSETAKSLGIDTINNLTAIYLKDVDVHSGAIPQSAFRHCRLKWEKVEINGQEMKLSDDRIVLLNPINGSGVFDSGRPVNSWEGNDIEGVAVSDHTAVFTDIDKPTSVTLTFTISQIMYNNVPTSDYVKKVIEQAEKLDVSALSEEEAEEFSKNLETLKELSADAGTPEKKLLSCYAKVKAVIDNRSYKQTEPDTENNEQTEITSTTEQPTVSDSSQAPTESSTSDNSGNNTGKVIIIICISAAAAAVLLFILIKAVGRKKK